jgi:alginate O-acetyltransferase complex protein AlgI
MVFNSFSFAIFFAIAWLANFFVPQRWRLRTLLLTSVAFYSSFWAPHLLIILALVAAITYLIGLRIGKEQDETSRLRLLWYGIAGNAACLLLIRFLPTLLIGRAWLAIGVSYYAMHAISYLADVYLRVQRPETSVEKVSVYLAFFPKLLQGPFERANILLPQLEKPYKFEYAKMRSGIVLFCWGLFKKAVIADRLALFVDAVYGDVHSFRGVTLLAATVLYALQIYVDFSGYTDMARGIGRTLNVELTENFNAPYLAKSVAEFWRRWHISFSRLLLDYVFTPLQMVWRRGMRIGVAAAILVTFIISGIWHGVGMTFLIWGLLHGIYMAVAVWTAPLEYRIFRVLGSNGESLLKVWQVTCTFCLVTFAWIFFRSSSLHDAVYVVSHLFDGLPCFMGELVSGLGLLGHGSGLRKYIPPNVDDNISEVVIGILGFIVMGFVQHLRKRVSLYSAPLIVRWAAYIFMVITIGMLAKLSNGNFIYLGF